MSISGAGSEVTALAESLQAYACAARQYYKKDLDSVSQITEKAVENAICDRKLDDCLNGLNANWYHSVIVTANEMFRDIKPNGTYVFYRGGKFVDTIYDVWRQFKSGSGISGDDKWNPSDIWMAKKTFAIETNFPTLTDYNRYIYDEFAKKNLIGVSLKLVPKGPAHHKIFNDGKPLIAKFRGIKLGENMFDSKDIYLQYTSEGKDGEIQLRNFSSRPVTSSWQGEIKGKTAAGGKIGGGIVMTAAIESGISRSKLMLPPSFTSQINKPSDATLKNFATMFKFLSGSSKSLDELKKEASIYQKQDVTWWMSKYLGVHYAYTIIKEKKQDDVIKWLFEYGSSATKNSSIFIKYS
jgi:hypothetical protein